MGIIVFHLAHILIFIPKPLQLPDRIGAEIALDADQRCVVKPAQAINLLGVLILVHPMAQNRHLLTGGIVQHLGHKKVRPIPCRIPADDIRPARHGHLIDFDHPCFRLHPLDLRKGVAAILVAKLPGFDRLNIFFQHSVDPLPVEDAVPCNAPAAFAVDIVVIRIGVPIAFQQPFIILV